MAHSLSVAFSGAPPVVQIRIPCVAMAVTGPPCALSNEPLPDRCPARQALQLKHQLSLEVSQDNASSMQQ